MISVSVRENFGKFLPLEKFVEISTIRENFGKFQNLGKLLCNTKNPSPNPLFFKILPPGIWEKKEKYFPLDNIKDYNSKDLLS